MSQVVRQLDLEGIEPAPIEAGMIVPHEWAHGPDYSQYGFAADRLYQYAPGSILNYKTDEEGQMVLMESWLSTFILCREAGIHVGFPREYDDWLEVPSLLTPVPAADTWGYDLYTRFWQRVRPYVEAGATPYASLSAASALSIPAVTELFGVSLADRAFWRPEVQLTFVEDFFGIRAGEVFEFAAQPGLQGTGVMLNVHDARVLARDQDGNPALLVHGLGQGHAVLCAYPIELMLGRTPNAFEGESPYWRLYRALKGLADIQSPFSVDQPEVEVGCWTGEGRDYVIIVNHTPGTVSGNVVASHKGQATRLRPEGPELVAEAGNTWLLNYLVSRVHYSSGGGNNSFHPQPPTE